MKLHLPKGLLVAVLAAMTGFTQSAWGAYEMPDQTYESGSEPTYSVTSGTDHLLYNYNQGDGSVINNAKIEVGSNSSMWVGPGNGTVPEEASTPTLVQLNGVISGSGTLKFNEYPSAAANFVIYELTNSSSTFSGTVSLENGWNTHADVQVNLNGVETAYAGATFGTSKDAQAILNIASSVSVAGLTDGASDRVTSTSTSNTLTLAGSSTYSYAGTLGSGTYHTYTLGESSTTFGTADSAALNIVKSGTGTQTFTGTANLGDVTVEAGILNFNGTTTFNGDISVDNAGTLNIYSAVTLNGSVTGALSIADMSGFQSSGQGSYSGGDVTGNGFLTDTFTIISSGSTTLKDVVIKYGNQTYMTDANGAISTQNKDVFYIWSGTESVSKVTQLGTSTVATASGSTLLVDTTTNATAVITGTTGAGNIKVNLENASDVVDATKPGIQITGTLDVTKGILYVGNPNGSLGGADTNFKASKLIVRNGGEFYSHFGQGTLNSGSPKEIEAAVYLESGAKLANKDGCVKYTGNIHFNVADANAETPAYNADGTVYLHTYWDKYINLSGLVEGSGRVEFSAGENGGGSYLALTGNNNPFSGTYAVTSDLSNGIGIVLGSENAAQYAGIELSGNNSYLQLNQSSTIKALNSTNATSIVKANTTAATLTVSEGSFAGKLQDGTNAALSLEKTGSGTLTLSGANTYSGGTEITGGTLIVSEGSSLGTGDVTVNGGNLEVSGQNAITATNLNITNGTVTANHAPGSDSSVISHSTTVNVNAGGTLKLTGHDMLGWGTNSAPANIVLKGSDENNVATLDIQDTASFTGVAPIEMKGNSVLTGKIYTTFDGGNITVSEGSNNKITVTEFRARRDVTLDIAKDAVLTIESVICNGNANEATQDLTKSNVGTLEITNTNNTWSDNQLKVTGGTLRLVGAANLPGGVTMYADTRLETGTGTIGNLTMADGSTLDADTAVSLNGTLTFNGVVNLDGAIKNALYAGEQTVKLFTGITSLVLNDTTYDSTARVAYNPVDLEEVFAFDGLEADKYQLHYSGSELFATLSVPEPATATLSLLALAGLCARRRRKS